jgi:hypothetical protein
MSFSFIAKYGGSPCLRCRQNVIAGQRVVFASGMSKTLLHYPSCPPKPEARVYFEHWDGCQVGKCPHGNDETLARITAERDAERASRAGETV